MDLLDTRISLVPDDGNEQPPTLRYFDHIQLGSTVNTGVSDASSKPPAFRPNSAVDKLRVSLSEAPTTLEAFDA